MRLPGARAGAHSIISVYIYIQLYLCNYYHHDHGLQINVMKVITVYQAIHGYSPIYKTRQDKFIQPIQCQDINILKLAHRRVPIKLI